MSRFKPNISVYNPDIFHHFFISLNSFISGAQAPSYERGTILFVTNNEPIRIGQLILFKTPTNKRYRQFLEKNRIEHNRAQNDSLLNTIPKHADDDIEDKLPFGRLPVIHHRVIKLNKCSNGTV